MKKVCVWTVFAICLLLGCATIAFAANLPASGDLADCTILWSIDGDGKLMISGTGAITSSSTYPWLEYVDQIKSITVGDGISSLPSGVFQGCNSLEEITLPFVGTSKTATSADAVFGAIFGYTYSSSESYISTTTYQYRNSSKYKYCHYYIPKTLRSVTITDAETIPANAFYNCDFLKEINLNDGITSIGSYAFYAATCLKNLTVPANVTTYGSGCFEDCGIEELIIGYGTETIPASAFENCASLAKLTLPNTIKSIQSDAFSGCYALNSGVVSYDECLVEWGKIDIALPNYEIIAAEKEFCAYDIINGYPAKCETTGLTDGYQCTLCRAIVVEREIIPATGHTLSSETIDPTCVDDGVVITTCAFCDHEERIILPALHHIEVVDPYVAPTCLTPGYTTGSHCSRCNAILEEQNELAALGHNWSTWIKISDSEHERTCMRCSTCEHEAHNRVYGKCTVCGDDNVSLWLSCKGVTIDFPKFITDSRIGIALYEEDGRMLRYVSSAWGKTQRQSFAVDASLNASYLKIFTFNENVEPLRDAISMQITDELGKHAYTESDEAAATCTKPGVKRITCVACGDSHTEETPALGHTPVEIPAVPATCSAKGLTAGEKCSVCGEILTAQRETPMTSHSWADADCTHPKTCRVCGVTSGQPLGHNCTAANGYTCSRCGYKMLNSIKLNINSCTICVGGTVALSFTTNPLGADYSSATWSSDKPSVATVDSSGCVQGVSNGTTTIRLTVENQYSGKKVATCTVTVKNPTVMLAINPNLSATSLSASSLYSTDSTGQLSSLDTMSKLDASREISNTYVDENGETITVYSIPADYTPEPDAEMQQIINKRQSEIKSGIKSGIMNSLTAQSYQVGSTKKILDGDGKTKNMICLYVGTRCTVWGATSDSSAITITSTHAQQIGSYFDSKYSAVVSSFGNWYDADEDGKLAIFCYDIDNDYQYGTGSSYTAGFFRMADLTASNGLINGKKTDYSYIGMGIDCIHIDTYPAMGSGLSKLQEVSSVYSTLVHECQHLINFSYQVLGSKYYTDMEDYLNEAMSMAAQHVICGTDSVSSRVDYFNSISYFDAAPLTYWDNYAEYILSNYANAYLFGQYVRTRYAQMVNDGQNGGTIYKQVMQNRQTQGGGDTLQIIADMLQTSKTQLVVDFWSAVYLKESRGVLGFNGESWANAIDPFVRSESFASVFLNNIRNGGCRYFSVSSAKYGDGKNLKVIYY